MVLLSIDREMEGLEEIVKVTDKTKKKVMEFLQKQAS